MRTSTRLSTLAVGAAVAALALAPAATAQDTSTHTASLDPLNDSGASGSATVEVSDGQATVTVETSNVSPGAPHAQHVHIGGQNVCPTSEADENDDGFISTPEGQPAYGGIKISLTTSGDVSADSALAVDRFPTASDAGAVSYSRTFDLPSGVTSSDVANGVIVQHGIADTSLGEDDSAYDGPDSPLMEGVPQEATLPAVCGDLTAAPAGGAQTGSGSTATTGFDPVTAMAIGVAGLGLVGAVALRRRVRA